MSSSFLIESADPGDFLEIAALDRVAWQDNAGSEFIPDGEHVWRIWCEHALVYVARAPQGRVAGAVLAFPCLDGSFCLHKIFIDRNFRGQGMGGDLFAKLFAALDALGAACFLTVDPENESAIRLYRRWGFNQSLHVTGYYRANEDRLVLTRSASTVTTGENP
jgi:ribosomal protein S18 acetylase RimI-like enzyme